MVAKKAYTIASLIAGIFLASNLIMSTMAQSAFAATTINGQGATFPAPLIELWIDRYASVRPTVVVNYAALGSGAGVTGITNELVEFGASDAPLNPTEQTTFASHGTPLTMPDTIGGVVPVINIPGIGDDQLRLTGSVLAKIYLGQITFWDSSAIKGLQTSTVAAKLPHKEIITVHRLDGSGTSFVFTEYLSKVSSTWASNVGASKTPTWPENPPKVIAANFNSGVGQAVLDTDYSIGYVELAYSLTNDIHSVQLKNKGGQYVIASLSSIKAAVNKYVSANSLPKGDESWAGVSMTNGPGTSSWPISSFTYFIVFEESKDNGAITSLTEAKELKRWLNWVNTSGQSSADDLSYVPLPLVVKNNNANTLKMMTYNGEQIPVSPTGAPS